MGENEIPSWEEITYLILFTQKGETVRVKRERFGEYIIELIEECMDEMKRYFKCIE